MRSQDKFRGCLIGGAAGDALGYAVEFMREREIFRRYGDGGITEYALSKGKALISDDTQMTLFTAGGLLYGTTRRMMRGIMGSYAGYINHAYLDWLKTQRQRYPLPEACYHTWLINVPGLFSPRAPGNTCLAALEEGGMGTPEAPINHSKGCGGVMRVAPIGLYFNDKKAWSIRDVCRIGAEAAALTHGHPLGWLPAAAFVQIVHEISQDGASVQDAVLHAIGTAEEMWPDTPELRSFTDLMKEAVDLAETDLKDLRAIHRLGEGWTGDEALAIAVYCALRHSGDIDGTLIAAVNHNGDSDSTGAIAGNIVGAQVGLSGIPAKYTENLELRGLILEMADDLWADCRISEYGDERDPVWQQKYVESSYRWEDSPSAQPGDPS